MSDPPASEYLHPDFQSNSLRVPQLRSILLEHGVEWPASAKKADLVDLFENFVRPKANTILSATSRVRPSAKGITVISENGSEAPSVISGTGVPKRRGRPKRQITREPETSAVENESDHELEAELEPPAKKLRGRKSRATTSTLPITPPAPASPSSDPPIFLGDPASPGVNVIIPTTSASKEKETKPKISKRAPRTTRASVGITSGSEAELEEEATTPIPRKSRGRASLATSSPAATRSVPSSSRRKTIASSSASQASEIHHIEEKPVIKPSPRSAHKRKSIATVEKMAELNEESEKDDVSEPEKKPRKTPKREKEDPAFSDFNPFQSGSEEAAERERRRRKSSIGVARTRPSQPRLSEPSQLRSPEPATTSPPAQTPGILRRVGPSREQLRTPPAATREELLQEKKLADAQNYNNLINDKLNQITNQDATPEPQVIVRSTVKPQLEAAPHSKALGMPLTINNPSSWILALLPLALCSGLLLNYQSHSAALGFCDSGSHINDIVITRENAIANARACIAKKATLDMQDPEAAKLVECDVRELPLIPFLPRPKNCAPCPPHAICENGQLTACEPEYIISSHPLSFLSPLTDGLPGLTPRSFPPSCRPDTAKKRMIGGLAQEMEKELARGRGAIVCSGGGLPDGRKGEGERFGIQESELKERFSARRGLKFSQEQFDEIFEAALNDLVQHEDVIESIDVNGISWYAASRTELTLPCRVKLELLSVLNRWKSQLASTLAVICLIMWANTTWKNRKAEKYRAEELVQVVLKRLQDQERLHYTDPATNPSPFIPPAQLRDLVIPPTGSSTYRNRLWSKVNDLIESNANVAVREQEVKGELWKTWEWQGVGERHVTWDQ